jgi:hypothetical protein
VPKCKGFAFATLSDLTDVSRVLSDWTWHTGCASSINETDVIGEGDELLREAHLSGMRAQSKADWDKLQEEYVAYRDKLLADSARAADVDADAKPVATLTTSSKARKQLITRSPSPAKMDVPRGKPGDGGPSQPTLSLSSLFPPGCVARVQGVDPSTNKTALRALFVASSLAIDYVDYTKGLDYVRLRSYLARFGSP